MERVKINDRSSHATNIILNLAMAYKQQFATVDLILASELETRGVDAFTLSLIKAEKQMRRIFTFLIFQNPAFECTHSQPLRLVLANNRRVYFEGFIRGINRILPRTLETIYGDNYNPDLEKFLLYTQDRNKIFHGQITDKSLSREDLVRRVDDIKKWCNHLGERLNDEIGYDGFSQSFKKSIRPLELTNFDSFDSVDKYATFLVNNIQRP